MFWSRATFKEVKIMRVRGRHPIGKYIGMLPLPLLVTRIIICSGSGIPYINNLQFVMSASWEESFHPNTSISILSIPKVKSSNPTCLNTKSISWMNFHFEWYPETPQCRSWWLAGFGWGDPHGAENDDLAFGIFWGVKWWGGVTKRRVGAFIFWWQQELRLVGGVNSNMFVYFHRKIG